MDEQQAESLLRAQGLTPERTGEADWARAIREAMDYEAEKATRPIRTGASRANSLTAGALKTRSPLRRAFEPLSPTELSNMQAMMHARLETLRARASASGGKRYEEPDDGPSCETCDGARFIRVTVDIKHPLFGVSVPCSCVGSLGIDERIARAQIPDRYRAMTFGAFGASGNVDALNFMEAWDGVGNVLLMGQPGRGKTHLAVAALRREVEERGRVGRFFYVPTLLDAVRRRYGDGEAESAQAYTDSLVGWPLLVLDDLGAERATPWAQEQLTGLIERRIAAGGSTVITTNLDTPEAFVAALGARIASRLGPGVYQWVRVTGDDMRQFELPR